MNKIIEAMAKKIEHALEPHVFIGESVAVEIAQAAYAAGVGAMTDEQLAQVYKATINVSGVEMTLSGLHKQAAERLRAALLELGRDDADQD